ncbi:GntR family transcriptional regulator [Paucisalibacillus sp. EB02]|uniref:GntR family transcriptional regulator n=1 Tax=Paucisalibacillus sp. EB02 TaxID=1347087 RepID=UPI0004BC1BCE|nr:GntR family transcriptional regulator [Paucisalibacillus sp. EB02]
MSKSLSNDSFVPLYHQLKEIIKEEIESGKWNYGDKIPSESVFTKEYNISRNTVQRAIEDLVHEGMLYREQGKGTFVSRPKYEQPLTKFYSFSKVMKELGMNPFDIIVSIEEKKVKKSVAKVLELDTDEMVLELVRVRCANEEPLIFETTYLPKKIVPTLKKEDIEKSSLFDHMRDKYDIVVSSSKEIFEPVLIREYESKYLQVKTGYPALLLDRIDYDNNKRPIGFLRSIIRGDRSRFYTELL